MHLGMQGNLLKCFLPSEIYNWREIGGDIDGCFISQNKLDNFLAVGARKTNQEHQGRRYWQKAKKRLPFEYFGFEL